jgi:hypothetical protein
MKGVADLCGASLRLLVRISRLDVFGSALWGAWEGGEKKGRV